MRKFVKFLADNYLIFCIYGFIGWLYEVSWFLIMRHKFVNRGVLFGPILPIYGFGILILLLILKKFIQKKHSAKNIIYNSISIFTIVTFIYTTIIEYTHDKIYSVTYYLNHYGIGLIIVNILTIIIGNLIIKKTKKDINTNVVLVFLAVWIITTLVEFIAHYYIETYSNKLLWDYSKDFLNIDRRVNWDASRNFAIGGTFLLFVVQPIIDKILNKISFKKELIISSIFAILMIIDILF